MLEEGKNYTLAEMREHKPMFFKNKSGPERYNVRRNHLITTDLETGKITVWQFHWNEAIVILSPVWHPEHKERGGHRNATIHEVLYGVDEMLRIGKLPIHPMNGHNYGAPRIDEEEWLCPACDHLNLYDVTIEDHGVCYSCHKEMLNGERCRGCYNYYQEGCDCDDEEPEGYVTRFNPSTGRYHTVDNHPSSTNAERNA